jgi:uncharacterized protein YqfB (UPF0267 family)
MPTEAELFEALRHRIAVCQRTGIRRYYNNSGQLHREDGPAVIWRDGSEAWFHNGKLIRLATALVLFAVGIQTGMVETIMETLYSKTAKSENISMPVLLKPVYQESL